MRISFFLILFDRMECDVFCLNGALLNVWCCWDLRPIKSRFILELFWKPATTMEMQSTYIMQHLLWQALLFGWNGKLLQFHKYFRMFVAKKILPSVCRHTCLNETILCNQCTLLSITVIFNTSCTLLYNTLSLRYSNYDNFAW